MLTADDRRPMAERAPAGRVHEHERSAPEHELGDDRREQRDKGLARDHFQEGAVEALA